MACFLTHSLYTDTSCCVVHLLNCLCVLWLVHAADADETKLSSLVRVGGVNKTADKTRQFCLVSTQFPNDFTLRQVIGLLILNDQISVTEWKTRAFSVNCLNYTGFCCLLTDFTVTSIQWRKFDVGWRWTKKRTGQKKPSTGWLISDKRINVCMPFHPSTVMGRAGLNREFV